MMTGMVQIIAGVLAMTGLAFFGGLLAQGIDRKLVARMQARLGPQLRQPWWDFQKLFQKENIVPAHAVPWLYNSAPVMAFAAVVTIFLYLPVGGFAPLLGRYGDMVLLLYLFAWPALALVIGGFASGSPYAALGAQREMITMIGYEFPLGATVIAFAWKLSSAGLAEPFSLETLGANPIWGQVGVFGFLGAVLLLISIILVTPGELSNVPFDAPEAKSELAEGLLVEYSGRNLALFYLSLGAKMIAINAFTVALFFPYNLSGWMPAALPAWAAVPLDILFYGFKIFIMMFFSVSLMRVATARFRITQVIDVYWKFSGTLTILALFLLMLDGKF
jgi:formate hydrogenlyase subunit 4